MTKAKPKKRKPQNRKPRRRAEASTAIVKRRDDGTFEKGATGNAGGRPTKVKHLVLIARDAVDEVVLAKLRKAVEREVFGWMQAASLLLAYGVGRPPDFEVVESIKREFEAKQMQAFDFSRLDENQARAFRELLALGYGGAAVTTATPATSANEEAKSDGNQT